MKSFKAYLLESAERLAFLKKQHTNIDMSHDPKGELKLQSVRPHDDKQPLAHALIDHFHKWANAAMTFAGKPGDRDRHPYTQYMVNQYKKKNFKIEDLERVRNSIADFHEYKHKLEKKDINQYPHYLDAAKAVSDHFAAQKAKDDKFPDGPRFEGHKGATLVHDDGKGTTIHQLNTHAAGRAARASCGHEDETGGWCFGWKKPTELPHLTQEHINDLWDHYKKKIKIVSHGYNKLSQINHGHLVAVTRNPAHDKEWEEFHASRRRFSHIAHHGPLQITKAWRIHKSKVPLLKRDGSNFFDHAEEVSLKESLDEAWHSSMKSPYKFDTSPIDIHKNPSAAETAKLIHNSGCKSLRGILHGNDAYVWDAERALHHDAENHLGFKGTCINIGKDRVSVSDRYINRDSESAETHGKNHPWIAKALPNHRKMFN